MSALFKRVRSSPHCRRGKRIRSRQWRAKTDLHAPADVLLGEC